MNDATMITIETRPGYSVKQSIRFWRLHIDKLKTQRFMSTKIIAETIEETLNMKIKQLEGRKQ